MLPLLAPILTQLAGAGLQKVADSVLDKGLDQVEEKLGIKLTPNEDGVLDDSKLAEIQMAAMKHQEFMAELDFKNTQDARNMNKEAMHNDDPWIRRFMPLFSAFWSVAGVSYLFAITFGTVPTANQRFADTILGILIGTIITTIINFYYGSSQSSRDKTKEMVKK
jgi:hypothetical protein